MTDQDNRDAMSARWWGFLVLDSPADRPIFVWIEHATRIELDHWAGLWMTPPHEAMGMPVLGVGRITVPVPLDEADDMKAWTEHGVLAELEQMLVIRALDGGIPNRACLN